MNTALHYIVKKKLIRSIKDGEIDFVEFNEEFKNSNPITAREEAFRHYQNYIDVLHEGKDREYRDDRRAREILASFIDPRINIGEKALDISEIYGNGIGVYMVIDEPISSRKSDYSKNHEIDFDDKVGDEILIHGIYSFGRDDPQTLMGGLNDEFRYYEHYGYNIKDYKRVVNFYECESGETEPNEILDTPFNWTGYDVPYYEESKTYEPQTESNITRYKKLIDGGENNQVEFKPNLLYYHDKNKEWSGYNLYVRHIIAKVICSFLNSNGGHLFVGVQDNKEVTGLAYDYSLARPEGKDPKDYFTLQVDKIIRDYFKSIAGNINGEFALIDGKEIYVFTVFPSKRKPVFINEYAKYKYTKSVSIDKQYSKEFYVRLAGSSCEPYTDIEDIANYCIEKWGK